MTLENFYIGGAWVAPHSTRAFPVLNPATEEKIGTIYHGNEDDLNKAVAAARAAFESYSQTSRDERIALFRCVAC